MTVFRIKRAFYGLRRMRMLWKVPLEVVSTPYIIRQTTDKLTKTRRASAPHLHASGATNNVQATLETFGAAYPTAETEFLPSHT